MGVVRKSIYLQLHWQEQLYGRQGTDLDNSTYVELVGKVVFKLSLVSNLLVADLKRSTKFC